MNIYHKKLHLAPALTYLVFFVLSALLILLFSHDILSDRVKGHLSAEKELTESTYQSIIGGFKSQADIIFYNRINVKDVIDLYKQVPTASETQRAAIRERLYELLLPVYRNISLYHLKQMHFHLSNNESFLRFHRPGRFGDDLTGVRDSVAYVNKTHKPVSGFEEGRIFNGYRFVYPLFDGNDYLGSVELSISMQTILERIRHAIHAETGFIILADTVKSKVFPEEQSYYVPSQLFENYMTEKVLAPRHASKTTALIRAYIRQNGSLDAMLARGRTFNFFETNDGNLYAITFVPVVNAISRKTVAYIIIDRRHGDLQARFFQYKVMAGVVVALLALLFYLLYRANLQRSAIEIDKRQLQSLIDLQKNVVILTDGHKLKFANRFFFESFGYDSLEDFLKEHECICELFIADERFFHLGKVPDGKQWVKTLMETPATRRIVKMLDREGTPRVYTVTINPIPGQRYIVVFTDISLTILNQRELERRASRDKLTHAYNREFLDSSFHKLCHSSNAQQKLLGVIMVDLDHFKRVNDTYGHNRGDEVLKTFVDVIRRAIRQEDFIIRWGGEEFLLLMMVDSLHSLTAIAEGVRERIETAAFAEVGQITASFGVTIYHEGDDLKTTIARSDKALYEAKASGRNIVVVDEAITETAL
ncbi:diguanylate cyclase [Sulfurimonas sp. HSL-3221]|uniref:sensor domain-containing diguanylate cyclase n=1 Tax=Sulfurimonadaceae TaxID=2771471 RepID=UPI001E61C9C0|nr:diguanylate cyclase [Sulfurimonas sp. HSL-3221]UFS61538.1 diguanylate cyclase [Sulfurimonas sp. HSL-3221]